MTHQVSDFRNKFHDPVRLVQIFKNDMLEQAILFKIKIFSTSLIFSIVEEIHWLIFLSVKYYHQIPVAFIYFSNIIPSNAPAYH